MRVFNQDFKLVPSGLSCFTKEASKKWDSRIYQCQSWVRPRQITHVGLIEIQILANGLIAPAVISIKCLKMWPYKKRVITVV
jgi:hypothetical protein